jgi:voltage-gated potassium channel
LRYRINNNFRFHKLQVAISLALLGIISGVVGYMILENISFLDALYMVIITISTVGFGEIKELSIEGKIFTIILIISYIGIFTYSVSVIATYLFDGEFRKTFKQYKMEREIKKIKDHVIVVGYGRNGLKTCEELHRNNVPFVVIEQNETIIEKIKLKGYLYIFGDASEDNNLLKANILEAKSFITSLPIDADNVFVVLSARKLNKDLMITSRAASEANMEKLKSAGANHVVLPESIGGHYMATLVSRPDLIEFYHLMTEDVDSSVCTEEVFCDELKEEYKNKSISTLDFRRKTGVNIIAVKNSEGKFIINPSPDSITEESTKLIALGTRDQIEKMKETYINKTEE